MTRPLRPRLARTATLTRVLPRPLVRLLRPIRRLLWRVRDVADPRGAAGPPRPAPEPAPIRLLVGPANFAGQATAWARAAEAFLPGVSALSMSVDRGGLIFPADYVVPLRAYRSASWAKQQRAWLAGGFSHLLIDAMRPVTGPLRGGDCRAELGPLREAGLQVGLVAHGSDVRLPSRHRELYPYSPFESGLKETAMLEEQAGRLGAIINGFDGPTFVSTPDLLDFVPRARWLPVVVDPTGWTPPARPALDRTKPVVLHVPSNPWLKGSHLADPVLEQLAERGLIDYRRLERVTPDEVRRQVLDADIVLDQLLLGLYSVAAVQAMVAGRLTLAHVADRVRERIPAQLPVVEVTPATLGAVVEQVVAEREAFAAVAAQGPAYARNLHDGRHSATVLAEFLAPPDEG